MDSKQLEIDMKMKEFLIGIVLSVSTFSCGEHDTDEVDGQMKIQTVSSGDLPAGILINGWDFQKAFQTEKGTQSNYVLLEEFRQGDLEVDGSVWKQRILIRQISSKNNLTILQDSTEGYELIDLGEETFKVFNANGKIGISLSYLVYSTQGEDPDVFKFFLRFGRDNYTFYRKIPQSDFRTAIDTINIERAVIVFPANTREFVNREISSQLLFFRKRLEDAEKMSEQ